MTGRGMFDSRNAPALFASIQGHCRQLRKMGGARIRTEIAELERLLGEIRSTIPHLQKAHDKSWWGARLKLASWAGYQSRLGPCGSIDKAGPSDGTVDFIFAPRGRGLKPLSSAEARLV